MSKKIAATLEEPLLIEMEETMKKEKFFETSEFVKHCIRHYLLESGSNAQTPTMTENQSNLMSVFTPSSHPPFT